MDICINRVASLLKIVYKNINLKQIYFLKKILFVWGWEGVYIRGGKWLRRLGGGVRSPPPFYLHVNAKDVGGESYSIINL